jgi:hypothetical protein
MENEIVVRVNDWDLITESGNEEEARVRDLDLGERLGYSRTRKVRELIKELVNAGHLPGIVQRPTVGRYEIRPGVFHETEEQEYFLTEEEALLVTTQSKTDKAMAVTKEVIAVFVAFRRGRISGQSPDQIVKGIESKLCDLLTYYNGQLERQAVAVQALVDQSQSTERAVEVLQKELGVLAARPGKSVPKVKKTEEERAEAKRAKALSKLIDYHLKRMG